MEVFMELAMIGLGKMGLNMATRLARGGHRVIGFARTDATVQEAIKLGAEGAYTLEEAVSKLNAPRMVWLMIPAGKVTHDTVQQLSTLLHEGDIGYARCYARAERDRICRLRYQRRDLGAHRGI
jgi:6-phosphogluconate dehydrogenase